jgi:trk system potassium uptake protein TrkH
MFQAITPRTAGFNTINQADMTNTSIIFTMLLMFIGGSPGSTAGGIKTTTFGVIIYTVISIIKGKENTEIFRRRVNHLIVLRSMAITFISLFMIICTVIVLSLFEDLSITNILFETISAFGTVGLSLGITPFLSDISKFALILLMFSGRVGVLTIVVSLLPTSTNTLPRYKLPEEKIVVG